MKSNSSVSNTSTVLPFLIKPNLAYEDNLQETYLQYLMLQDAPDVNNNLYYFQKNSY